MATHVGSGLEDPWEGKVLADRYRIGRRIGSGAKGNVYEAEHQLLGRPVAVKVLHQRYADNDDLIRRFLHEARAVGALGHANIVQSFDVARSDDGSPFLVMELLRGQSLAERLAKESVIPVDEAVGIAVQVLAALEWAHQQGVVHRDIKPGNVFLTEQFVAKVLDFGTSKLADGPSVDRDAGNLTGSPQYMAPEQIADADGVDGRADVYSTGAMLYKMLSGRTPFENVELPRLLNLIAKGDPPALEELVPSLDAGLCSVVRRAMEKDPDNRYATAAEFSSDLQSCVSLVGFHTSSWSSVSGPYFTGPGSGTFESTGRPTSSGYLTAPDASPASAPDGRHEQPAPIPHPPASWKPDLIWGALIGLGIAGLLILLLLD
ncbi:MAG: serine/threonine protein kinase [Myxococcales bacterium]|nr:serine/threonine protein kinase [Myxococcales bacterium]